MTTRRNIITIMLALMIAACAPTAETTMPDVNTNFLTNPDFEGGFSDTEYEEIAFGWQIWSERAEDDPNYHRAPEYYPASDALDIGIYSQIQSGENAQLLFAFFQTQDAGIYQQITGLTPNTELKFTAHAHVFSNNLEDLNRSEYAGGVTVQVGIDPNGGTNPTADDVIYSDAVAIYDTYTQYGIVATATSDTVTVFVRTVIREPVRMTTIFIDDAALEIHR